MTAVAPSVKPLVVALVGNPNTGKTTLFNALAGLRQHVGNYPGVTVESKKGRCEHADRTIEIVDLPGTYSLAPRSPDEMVAVDVILGHLPGESRPDVVVSIVDASNLKRNLYLTTQVMELGVPVVLALNMIDVATSQGIQIDVERLERQLGIPVVPIQANKQTGLDRLKDAILAASERRQLPIGPSFPEAFEREAQELEAVLGSAIEPFLVRRLILDIGGYTAIAVEKSATPGRNGDDWRPRIDAARQRLAEVGCSVPGVEARTRYAWIAQVLDGCVQHPAQRPVTWTDRIDCVLTHRVWGTLAFLALMFVVFQSIFTWAGPLMDAINGVKDALAGWLAEALPPGALTSLLVDGVVKGVGAVVVFLPQIVILFGFIAILEDCGYMARAAYLMDRLMARCGLSGKSFIPMLSSVACAVPGIMATRVIENYRDRLATILVAPLMSCSARLPVYILLIGAFLPVRSEANPAGYPWWTPGLALFAMYAIGIVVAPLAAWGLKRTLLRGETPVFVMEMPVYKRPSLRGVVRRMVDAGWAFLYRAGSLILASMIVVWALLYFPSVNEDGVPYETLIGRAYEAVAKEREAAKAIEVRIAEVKSRLGWLAWQAWWPGAMDGETLARETAALEERIAVLEKEKESLDETIEPAANDAHRLMGEWKSRSWLGRLGHAIEPVVRPLGWDWRIGTAALASFPAREVVVGALGIIYNLGDVDAGEIQDSPNVADTPLALALQSAVWDDDPTRKVFTLPVAFSVMVFFALCCQCASTLAVIRRETNSWFWPAFTFVYMTSLAYLGALVVYQVGTLLTSGS
jgi:ferrous iron transport protein B